MSNNGWLQGFFSQNIQAGNGNALQNIPQNAMQNQYNQQIQQQANTGQAQQGPPLPTWNEQVPDDECEFVGKLSRFGGYGQYISGFPPRPSHQLEFCQRCMFL